MIPRCILIATELDPATGRSSALSRDQHELHIDRQIRLALEQKSHPVVVVGADGDDLLRASRWVRQCEFVFNPHPDFLSSLCAGANAVGKPAFFTMANVRLASVWNWQHFGKAWESPSEHRTHILTEASSLATLTEHPGFLTQRGVDFFAQVEPRSAHEFAGELLIHTTPVCAFAEPSAA